MSELIISVAGMRGVVGKTLTLQTVLPYVAAFSHCSPGGSFVITRDSRASGAFFADAIHATLNALGRSTIDGAIAATPTTGFLVRQLNAVGGIQITASHNPSEYNGIKLFSLHGRILSNNEGKKVVEKYNEYAESSPSMPIHWNRYDDIGVRTPFLNLTSGHLAAVTHTIDYDAVREKKYKVLLDANHGAGGLLGEWLLDGLDCQVTVLGQQPSGLFAHQPEPTPDNLVSVCEQVKRLNVDVAFCQDPDADRLAIIDGDGRYIGEEKTVALCVEHLLNTATSSQPHPCKRTLGPIVINCATSRMSEDIAKKYDVPVYRSAVGEANVVDLMLAKKAMFGGEGNGGPIDPKVGYVRDSFVGMAHILDAMARTEKTIAQLADMLPQYSLAKRKTTVRSEDIPKYLDRVAEAYKQFPTDRLDGVRIDCGDAWVLLRGSNTEPIIRFFAEAPTDERANQLCDEIEALLAKP